MAEVAVDHTDTEKQQQTGGMRDLFQLMRPIRGQIIAIVILTVFATALRFAPSVAIAQVAMKYATEGTVDGDYLLWWVVVGGLGLVIGHMIILWATGYCHRVEAKFRCELRKQVAKKLSEVPLGWYDNNSSGSVKKLVRDDVAAVHTLVAHAPVDLVTALALPVISIVYLLFYDWLYTLGLLLFLVLVVVIGVLAMDKDNKHITEEWMGTQARLSHLLVEMTEGIATVKNFGGTNQLMRHFDSALTELADTTKRWMDGTGRGQNVISAFVGPVGMLLPVFGIGWLIITYTDAPPMVLVPFLMVGLGLPSGVLSAVGLVRFVTTGLEAMTRIRALMAVEPLPAASNPKSMPPGDLGVEVNNVSFSYVPGHPVLRDVSVSFPAGSVTAIVGPSGSGKTTLTRLIARFMDVDSGSITIGGVDIRDLAEDQLLGQLAIVDQDVALIQDTVAANISLGHPDATREEVIAAAQGAQIHDRIMKLPGGYDAAVGTAGVQLSGGEQQRMTLARAMLRNAPIVLLDEATAYADPHSEREIQKALSKLAADRTVIVIAHRLSSIVGVDNIVVFDGGRVVEQGTHDELLAQRGTYYELWEAQQ